MSHSEFACVKSAPIFSDLADEIIAQLVTISTHQKEYMAGSYIYHPDDDLAGLFLVDSGQVDILSVNDNGQEILLYSLHSHQMNVEASLFTDEKHHHFARAKTDAKICMIRRKNFQDLLHQHPELAIKILNAYGKRITELENLQISLSLQSADERLMLYLNKMSNINMQKTFRLNGTKKELAASLNIAPETLSRLFNKLSHDGKIKLNKRDITVL